MHGWPPPQHLFGHQVGQILTIWAKGGMDFCSKTVRLHPIHPMFFCHFIHLKKTCRCQHINLHLRSFCVVTLGKIAISASHVGLAVGSEAGLILQDCSGRPSWWPGIWKGFKCENKRLERKENTLLQLCSLLHRCLYWPKWKWWRRYGRTGCLTL